MGFDKSEGIMKKLIMLAVVFILMAAFLPTLADSVWMPMDDYFMDTWNPESDNTCDYQERAYYLAAGENGYVTAMKTPLDQTRINSYPNGTEFKIGFVCGKGSSQWGAIEAVRLNGQTEFTEDWLGQSGYIAFSDLVRAYDSEAFSEDHQNEIRPFDESSYDFCSADEFVLWQAPNSGVQLEYVSADYIGYMCMEFDPSSDFRMFHLGGTYVDPAGNRWVEATLRRASEHGWFCLDHMTEGGVKPVY